VGSRLEGKNAVVTGAGRGIGRELALALAAEGAKVIVNDAGVERDGKGGSTSPADEVVQLIKDRGGLAVANYESVADHAAADRIIEACVDNFGRIDILCNLAGIARERMVFNLPEEDWDAVIAVHLKGTFNCTKHACIRMREQKGGRIINTTSEAWRGTVGQANYSAAKGGIVSFTRSVAREMAKYGVTCNAICPGAATRMTLDEEVKAGFQKRYEAGLITKERLDLVLNMPGPEFVPPIVVYLASDEASYISGKVFGCGGGLITLYSEPEPIKSIDKDYQKEGPWNLDELIELIPKKLAADIAPLVTPTK
jgi:NAD(P)-dependent dehydrogenase (short-subunit alcohol dehydrogenase family)